MAWVYGIECGEFIKIGVATRIEARLKTMELYNPLPLKVVMRRRAPDPYFIEKRMHQRLAANAVGREWFRITATQARETYALALEDAKEQRRQQLAWEQRSLLREATQVERTLRREVRNA